MPGPAPRPLAEGILLLGPSGGQPRLLHSRCGACGALAFPPRSRCAACSAEDLTREEAPSTGSVYSWTTAPGSSPPRVVAMVRLDNGLMVQGPVDAAPEAMVIDAHARLVPSPAGEADDGTTLLSYAFELVSPEQA